MSSEDEPVSTPDPVVVASCDQPECSWEYRSSADAPDSLREEVLAEHRWTAHDLAPEDDD